MPGVPRKSLPDAIGAYRGGKPCLHVAATARPAKAETGTRQATAVKIRREKEGVQKGKIPPCRIGYLISVSNRDTNKSRVPNTFWTPSENKE